MVSRDRTSIKLEFQDQCVEEDFLTILNEINEIRPLTVKHGGVWSNEREPIGTQVRLIDPVVKQSCHVIFQVARCES